MDYAFEIKNLTKKYEGFTLDNVSFALPKGCIMGMIGENGAGKTTIIKLMMGLSKADDGEINVLGMNIKTSPADLKEHIGAVLDESGLPGNLCFKEINSVMKRIFRTWDEDKFRNLGVKFGLDEKKKIRDYSKGMKVKLSIAVALSHDSKLLILDEATNGLDPIARDEMLDIFMEFIQDENHSILISSHIINDLEKICDYITFIHEGKLYFSEEKDRILEDYVIAKCDDADFARIDSAGVFGYNKTRFGVEVLTKREYVDSRYVVERPTIEEIMVFLAKERN